MPSDAFLQPFFFAANCLRDQSGFGCCPEVFFSCRPRQAVFSGFRVQFAELFIADNQTIIIVPQGKCFLHAINGGRKQLLRLPGFLLRLYLRGDETPDATIAGKISILVKLWKSITS